MVKAGLPRYAADITGQACSTTGKSSTLGAGSITSLLKRQWMRLVGKLTLEKKGLAEQPVSKKRQIICLGVLRWGCRLMKLARSSFYHKSPEKREKKADLRGKIEVS
ncbi:hypothetical protein M1N18_00425 [Dehalococcoidales bacterium]|nr:hypothetical protein [Dehalococcoidales bacterium]